MLSSDARAYIDRTVQIEYIDRSGTARNETTEVYDLGFLPVGGPCMITDVGEIRLDRVLNCIPIASELQEAA